jgi:hypothetical protein
MIQLTSKTERCQKMSDSRDEKSKQKWARVMQKGVENVIREQPDAFLRRVRRGIPTEYRYVSVVRVYIMIGGRFGKRVCIVGPGRLKVYTPNCRLLRIHGHR